MRTPVNREHVVRSRKLLIKKNTYIYNYWVLRKVTEHSMDFKERWLRQLLIRNLSPVRKIVRERKECSANVHVENGGEKHALLRLIIRGTFLKWGKETFLFSWRLVPFFCCPNSHLRNLNLWNAQKLCFLFFVSRLETFPRRICRFRTMPNEELRNVRPERP